MDAFGFSFDLDSAPEGLTPEAVRSFQVLILRFFEEQGREFPWRETTDPYAILVSELMLQQTQVDRVLPKYHEWLGKFPSLAALAEAPESEVASTWRPLGYNIRPRRLQAIARETVAEQLTLEMIAT